MGLPDIIRLWEKIENIDRYQTALNDLQNAFKSSLKCIFTNFKNRSVADFDGALGSGLDFT